MAEVVSKFPEYAMLRGRNDKFLDGRVWKITKDECRSTLRRRAETLRMTARVAGKKLRTTIKGDELYVQAY